ncbi:hypothetical protein AMAG_15027 [Allomyces macrogynus ATCC 38327]|uniref:NmrA-like domain-containing protein n=1 Tax=Allomyces macrogynus (strain ATCC 38327) TaxID=578462 RepID=A0A0L0T856_ALLM3|nr:hypothetical protein AMAG_15027 [Allomyces macrogynus ATCC 38327]|eukprot:KNE70937.1 hypothetical protein AMAG_15027 [Allomyces macrogynus ATCC 38327]
MSSTGKIVITAGETMTSGMIAKQLAELAPQRAEVLLCAQDKSKMPQQIMSTLQQASNVKIMECDPKDTKALTECLRGVDMLALVPPTTADKFEIANKWLQAAAEAGIKNAVLLSWAGCNDATNHPSLCKFCDLETAFNNASSIDNKAIVRAGFYIQNALTYAKQIVHDHCLPAPTGDGKWAPLDAETLGKAMAMMLLESPMRSTVRGQTLTFTGTESMSASGMATMLAKAMKTNVQFKNVTRDEAKSLLKQSPAMSDAEIGALLDQYDLIQQGKMDFVSKDMENMLAIKHPSLEEVITRDMAKIKTMAEQQPMVA